MALKITERLLSDCDQQRIQLIADSYLDMLHVMLESVHTELQIMATNSVSAVMYKAHVFVLQWSIYTINSRLILYIERCKTLSVLVISGYIKINKYNTYRLYIHNQLLHNEGMDRPQVMYRLHQVKDSM